MVGVASSSLALVASLLALRVIDGLSRSSSGRARSACRLLGRRMSLRGSLGTSGTSGSNTRSISRFRATSKTKLSAVGVDGFPIVLFYVVFFTAAVAILVVVAEGVVCLFWCVVSGISIDNPKSKAEAKKKGNGMYSPFHQTYE